MWTVRSCEVMFDKFDLQGCLPECEVLHQNEVKLSGAVILILRDM
jgi:hypothetical protein